MVTILTVLCFHFVFHPIYIVYDADISGALKMQKNEMIHTAKDSSSKSTATTGHNSESRHYVMGLLFIPLSQ